jgi:hypothetical protein
MSCRVAARARTRLPACCTNTRHATGDRVLTPWLTVISRSLDGMPLVDVRLRRVGDELTGVAATVRVCRAAVQCCGAAVVWAPAGRQQGGCLQQQQRRD